jgi:hypothetical protein
MKPFLLDVWHDLRSKHLLPVVAALVLALVAIPALLLKPADAADGPEQVQAPAAAQMAKTQLVEDEPAPGTGSDLGVFDPEDPFKPDGPTGEAAGDGVVEVAEAPSDSAPQGPEIGVLPVVPVGPDGEIVEPAPAPQPAPAPRRVTKSFEYVVDATFWNGSKRRDVKGMRKLEMLPSESAPLLIFMGATQGGGNALFLIDSTLDATGEGSCKPSRDDCAFVTIGPGAEETFTDATGATYRLRIDEIRKVAPRAGASRASAQAGAGAPRRFLSPFMPDVVVEAETVTVPSSVPANGR